MSKSIFQSAYDWIQSLKTPIWLRDALGEIQDLIIGVLLSVGKEYLRQIQAKVYEVNEMEIPSEKKFKIVFNYAKDLMPNAKDSVLNALINLLVLKIKGFTF